MSDFFWFSDAQWARIGPLLPTDTRGMARVDDRRVLSGIVHALRNGGRWADCPREVYGPKKTLYNRFVRWAERGIWERIFSALAGGEDAPDRLFIDSTCIKVHRCAGGGKGGPWPMASAAPRGAATPSSTLSAMRKAGPSSCSCTTSPPKTDDLGGTVEVSERIFHSLRLGSAPSRLERICSDTARQGGTLPT